MPAKADFTERLNRIEKISNASPQQRAKAHTPVPGVVGDGATKAKRRAGVGSSVGAALSMLSGMAFGLVILTGGVAVFANELDAMAPDGMSVSQFVTATPILAELKDFSDTFRQTQTEIAEQQ